MAKKYSKQDEKIIKDLMNTLYDQHKLSGGNFFTDFVHGFTVPFKQFGHLLSLIPEVGPALASVVTPVAEAIDTAVPGHRYANMSDAFSGKYIQGTGRGRGRPRKIPKEIKINVNIEDPMKRDKVFTETANQLIDEENKNVVGKRPRGRPKKIQGSGLMDVIGDKYIKYRAKKDENAKKDKEILARYHDNRIAKEASDASAPVVGSGKRKSMKGGNIFKDVFKEVYKGAKYIRNPAEVVTDLTKPKTGRGRPKGSKNKK